MSKYPNQSPYAAFNNNPIYFNDPLGLEGEPPGGLPENPNDLDVATGDDGKDYQWVEGDDGNGSWMYKRDGGGVTGDKPNRYPSTEEELAEAGIIGPGRSYIQDFENLSSFERKMVVKGAILNPENSASFDAKVRTNDMPLWTIGCGFGCWGLYEEFRIGVGPEESIFLSEHKATKDLKNKSNEIKRLRKVIYEKFEGDFDKLLETSQERGGWIYTDFLSHKGRFMPWEEGVNTSNLLEHSQRMYYMTRSMKFLFL